MIVGNESNYQKVDLYTLKEIHSMPFKNLNEIKQKEIVPGFNAKFIHSSNMTFAYWDIKEGALLPTHSHPHEQVTNIIEGMFEMKIGTEKKILTRGDVAIIPSDVDHSGKALTHCIIIDVFYPVREDYK